MTSLAERVKNICLGITNPIYRLEIRNQYHRNIQGEIDDDFHSPWLYCYKAQRDDLSQGSLVWMLHSDGCKLPGEVDDELHYTSCDKYPPRCWEYSKGFMQWTPCTTQEAIEMLRMVKDQIPHEFLFHKDEILRSTVAKLLKEDTK